MSITAHRRTGGGTGAKAWLPMLVPPLAALLYPFALKGFNASVTRIPEGDAGALALSSLSAAVYLALAFAIPLIAILAAMSLSGIGRPTAAQLRAKRDSGAHLRHLLCPATQLVLAFSGGRSSKYSGWVVSISARKAGENWSATFSRFAPGRVFFKISSSAESNAFSTAGDRRGS